MATWRLRAIFLVLATAPLALMALQGYRMAAQQEESSRAALDAIVRERLGDIRRTLAATVAARGRELSRLCDVTGLGAAAMRERARGQAFARQLALLSPDGTLRHPARGSTATRDEEVFAARLSHLLDEGGLKPTMAVMDESANAGTSSGAVDPTPNEGWHAWYWDEGLQLVYWKRLSGGEVALAEVTRPRLLAALLADLPASTPDESHQARVALVDAAGRHLYQWGGYRPGEGEPPLAEEALDEPLAAWRLRYHAGEESVATGGSAAAALGLGIGAVALAWLGLALWGYRESMRAAREARQRVGFVSQVSHEVRTPLTNIGLYAELLAESLAEDDPAQAKLGVILSESRRLGRLIANVLAFSRESRGAPTIRPRRCALDDVVDRALSHFAPALSARGIAVTRHPGAAEARMLDPDAVEQIVGNLLSNVEKYAPGAPVTVTTALEGDRARLAVYDGGPGIPPGEREAVFAPFVRLSDRLTEGVAGTGIGLTIARTLARLHGGELRILATDVGACFEATLAAPATADATENTACAS